MPRFRQIHRRDTSPFRNWKWAHPTVTLIAVALAAPLAAHAQSGTPFDTGFTAIQTLFTGTIAKVASLVAIVIGGYGFAHGEPGAKKALAVSPPAQASPSWQ